MQMNGCNLTNFETLHRELKSPPKFKSSLLIFTSNYKLHFHLQDAKHALNVTVVQRKRVMLDLLEILLIIFYAVFKQYYFLLSYVSGLSGMEVDAQNLKTRLEVRSWVYLPFHLCLFLDF